MNDELHKIAAAFDIEGHCTEIELLKRGHINDTYISTWVDSEHKNYIHQKINSNVFKDISGLTQNVVRVTEHIRSKLSLAEDSVFDTTLRLIPVKNDDWIFKSADGGFWRTYEYIENSTSYYVCQGAGQANEAAKTCGRFQNYIVDLDPSDFNITIPRFHDSIYRYESLDSAIKLDSAERVNLVGKEIEFAKQRFDEAGIVMKALETGKIPWRVTHNDLKFNNVLFDLTSKRGLAVVDLDTCMPGSVLFDFGDLARNTSVPADEDEADLSKVYMDLDYYRSLAEGYFGEIGRWLQIGEWELAAQSPKLLTLTLGVRFLTDFLSGDKYFKVDYPEHNLVRARNQFKIVSSMEEQINEMESVINEIRSNF